MKVRITFNVGNNNVPGMKEVSKQMLTVIHSQVVGLIILSYFDLSSVTTNKHSNTHILYKQRCWLSLMYLKSNDRIQLNSFVDFRTR